MEPRQLLATFTVTSSLNSGPGSLRQAILESNANEGTDLVRFNIPGGGVQRIRPTTPLPEITDPISIDATSQPGYAGSPLVEIDGSNIFFPNSNVRIFGIDGLRIVAGSSTVRGLAINRFTGNGIALVQGGRNTIEGNFIGTDVTGTIDLGNFGSGILTIDSRGNQIGGATPAARNVISGNESSGVTLVTSTGRGQIGGNIIQGNLIGTDAAGEFDLGNSGDGVNIDTAGNLVGGPVAAQGNTIAFNGGTGVRVGFFSGQQGRDGNSILTNSIYQNLGLGIDLGSFGPDSNDEFDPDLGPNTLQNWPELTAAFRDGTSTVVEGRVVSTPDTSFTVQFFSNPTADPSGFGEGRTYIGQVSVATDITGRATFAARLPVSVAPGQLVTATATDQNGSTSEFSRIRRVTAEATADLSVSLAVAPTGAQGIAYVATVVNNGPASAGSVRLTDVLPAGVTFTSAETSKGTVSEAGGVVTANLGTLRSGESVKVTIIVAAARVGDVVNTVEVTGDGLDPLDDNNTAEASFFVHPGAIDTVGPVVIRQRLVTDRRSIRGIELTFNEDLDRASAEDLLNYGLRLLGRTPRSRPNGGTVVPLRLASYDANARTVILTPRKPLSIGPFYELTSNGPDAPGLTDTAGNLLDGDYNGLPDGILRTLVGRGTPTRPVNQQLPVPVAQRQSPRRVPRPAPTVVIEHATTRRVTRTGR